MRRSAVLTAALVVIALLAACSTGSRVDLGGPSAGNLTAAIAGEPDQLDPQKSTAYFFSFEVLENVFDTLVEPDENLEMRPPALAESWQVSPPTSSRGPSVCGPGSPGTTVPPRSAPPTSSTPIGGSSTANSPTSTS